MTPGVSAARRRECTSLHRFPAFVIFLARAARPEKRSMRASQQFRLIFVFAAPGTARTANESRWRGSPAPAYSLRTKSEDISSPMHRKIRSRRVALLRRIRRQAPRRLRERLWVGACQLSLHRARGLLRRIVLHLVQTPSGLRQKVQRAPHLFACDFLNSRCAPLGKFIAPFVARFVTGFVAGFVLRLICRFRFSSAVTKFANTASRRASSGMLIRNALDAVLVAHSDQSGRGRGARLSVLFAEAVRGVHGVCQ